MHIKIKRTKILLLAHLDLQMELVFYFFSRLHDMTMNAAPGRYVVHDTGISGYYQQNLTRLQIIDGILRTYDRQRTQQATCIKLVRTHRYQASGICSTRRGATLT